ncbi:MAG TPA: hypothetical protein VLT36_10200 [Candidatus Dormibacteraeota bacterium]|nr:hypothetical protein [Candidatus Dormibacteraeota bacterium]
MPNIYFTLDNTLVDSVGGSLALAGFSHGVTTNFWGKALSAASFRTSPTTDILTNGNDLFAGGGAPSTRNPIAP